ncbi:MAG: hypothetical protein AB9888_08390 [Bacteroidales bacterium]
MCKTAHFSVDDTIWLFENLEHFHYTSAFEQPVLGFFREMHQKYGSAVSFYCFGNFQGLRLLDMTDAFQGEFEANSDWLRFGFHAADDIVRYSSCSSEKARDDYAFVMMELRRIAGEKALDHFPRIHNYAGSKECLVAMTREGLRGLLCATDSRQNYCLSLKENDLLNSDGVWEDREISLQFIKTDIQTERTKNMSEALDGLDGKSHWEAFTHEWAMNEENKVKIEYFCRQTSEQGYRWCLPRGLR